MKDSLTQLDESNRIELSARRLLLDTGLGDYLKSIGPLEIDGSLALHLMTRRDIDLRIITGEPIDTLTIRGRLSEILVKIPSVWNLQVVDLIAHPGRGKPSGLWMGLKLDFEGHEWHLDVWVAASQSAFARQAIHISSEVRSLIVNLDTEERSKLLDLKVGLNDAFPTVPSCLVYFGYVKCGIRSRRQLSELVVLYTSKPAYFES